MSQPAPILIVGTGQAGAMAAAELRKLGYGGQIVMLGNEAHAPYERPPLSKAVLACAAEAGKISVHPDGFYAEQGIEVRQGTHVISIDPANKLVTCHDGEVLSYSACLLATGGSARILPQLPPGTPGVHYLRTMDDANRLREAMAQATDILIIGGGFLGLEAASTALGQGLNVTLVESNHRLLGRAVPSEFGDWLEQRVRARGVDLRLGRQIVEIASRDDSVHLRFSDDTALQAPLVVVAIGLTPNVELAANAGLVRHPINGGIEVDEHCRTSSAGIYAAGDCTSQHLPMFGGQVRLESWQNANEQARIAAAAMLGVEATPAAVPWFWTDQFDCNIQMIGAGHAECEYTWRGTAAADADTPKFLLLAVRQGRLCQGIAVNAGADLRQLRPLIGQPLDKYLPELGNPALQLRQLVRDIQADLPSAATAEGQSSRSLH